MDQRSGDGLNQWMIKNLRVLSEELLVPDFELPDARIASALNKIIQNTPLQEKGQFGGNVSSQRRSFPSRKTDCLPDLRILPGHWGQRFCRELRRPIHICSSK